MAILLSETDHGELTRYTTVLSKLSFFYYFIYDCTFFGGRAFSVLLFGQDCYNSEIYLMLELHL